MIGLLPFCLLFLFILWKPIQSMVPEYNLAWHIPVFSHYVEGKSIPEVVRFLFSFTPDTLGQPFSRLQHVLIIHGLGLETKHLALASALLHFVNAGLLFGLTQRLGFTRRVARLSGLTYLALFAHFHAIFWPVAIQHLLSVTSILAVLLLYLRTENQIQTGSRGWRRGFLATLGVWAAASLQRGPMMLPALLLTHLGFDSKNAKERLGRFDRWLPGFLLSMIYPIGLIAFAGDVIVNDRVVRYPLPAVWKAAGLFLGGLACLFLIRQVLAGAPYPRRIRRTGLALALGAATILFLALCWKDPRQLLLAYNGWAPFHALFASFLEPIRTVFLMSSTEPFYLVPPQISFLGLLLSLGTLGIFLRVFLLKNRSLLLLGAWYGFCLIHLLHSPSSFPSQVPSRYLIYISPIFAIVFSSVGAYLFDRFTPKAPKGSGRPLGFARGRPGAFWKEMVLLGIWAGLAVSNLVAIRLALFRGNLANTYLTYDYVRTAHLIRQEISRSGGEGPPSDSRPITVNNVMPMACFEFSPDDPARYETFRTVMRETLGDRSPREIRVNRPPLQGEIPGDRVYRLKEASITDSKGRSIDPFAQLFEEALLALGRHQDEKALGLFQQAIQTGPFLLSYVLPGLRLADSRWVTDGNDLRGWIHAIGSAYRTPSWKSCGDSQRVEFLLKMMNKELSDYILCFFYVSYLTYRAGDEAGSQHWLSQIWFLERQPETLVARIERAPLVNSDPSMLEFLDRVKDPTFFTNPIPWRGENYGWGRFMLRLFSLEVVG